MTRLAIVVLNYNGKEILQRHLPDLIQHTPAYPIYVADNGSSDGSLEFVKQNFPSVHTIDLQENWGYAGGYNKALDQIDTEYFILINSDVKVTANWADVLVELIQQSKEIGIVQPKIRSYFNPEYFEYAGAAGGFIDSFGYPFCRGRIFNYIEQDFGQYDQVTDIDWASGSCFIIRSDLFKKHKFDADFFAHMEEIDLCWRIRDSGYRILFTPYSIVFHEGGGTLSYSHPKKTFLNFRNGLCLLIKNYSFIQLITYFPIRVILDYVAAMMFLLKGQRRHFWSILKAHFEISKRIRYWFSKRKPAKSKSKRDLRCIVFSYFVLGRKTYRSLNYK